jgi:NAD(P)H-dependent flavin oxidoreductase YrpB (nitropropane dioxygenase family)
MWPKTELIDLLKIAHPIIQAPLENLSGVDWAIAEE